MQFKGIEVTSKDSAWSVDIKKAFAVFFHVRLDQQISKRQGYFANFKTPANFEPVEVTEVQEFVSNLLNLLLILLSLLKSYLS